MVAGDDPGISKIIPAGTPSPFRSLSEVPEALRVHIGRPSARPVEAPSPYRLQHFTSNEALEAERAEFQKLVDDADLDPQIRRVIDERNREYVETSQARAAALTEIARRQDVEYQRFASRLKLTPWTNFPTSWLSYDYIQNSHILRRKGLHPKGIATAILQEAIFRLLRNVLTPNILRQSTPTLA